MSDEEIPEIYCGDCGCIADDEICPRCMAEIVDMRRRSGLYQGDRRWNGESISRHRDRIFDATVLVDVREKPACPKKTPKR
jgi:hypothetical protein